MDFKMNKSLNEAKKWLQMATERHVNGHIDNELDCMEKNLKKAKASLKDIGSSEKEISKMRATGYLNEAKKWLQMATEHHVDGYIDNEQDCMEEYQCFFEGQRLF